MNMSHLYSALVFLSFYSTYAMENPNNELWSTLLSYQTKENYCETRNEIQELIKAGASIDKPNTDGLVPVTWALNSNYYDVYELLLENNAKIIKHEKFRSDDRFYYLTLKHLVHRKIEEYKKVIRALLIYFNRLKIPIKIIPMIKAPVMDQIKADCKELVLPYRRSILLNEKDLLHPDRIDDTILRFITLFMG